VPHAGPGRPRIVGQYVLERAIGIGGQGDVFAAHDTLLLRPVAMKRLRHASSHDSDLPLHEARRSAGLRHAAFVRIHGVVEDDSGHWIVMERVFGRELSTVVRDGPMPVAMAVDLMRQAAKALLEVHRARLAHGDIKPSNLMLQADGLLRILDFGVARSFDVAGADATDAGTQAGTLAYMAPERRAGVSPAPASDIFALGAVLFELVGGRRRCLMAPSDVESSEGGPSWLFPQELPQPLVALIRAMSASVPEARPAGMDAVVRALDALAAALSSLQPQEVRSRAGQVSLRASLLLVALLAAVQSLRRALNGRRCPRVRLRDLRRRQAPGRGLSPVAWAFSAASGATRPPPPASRSTSSTPSGRTGCSATAASCRSAHRRFPAAWCRPG
jgi:eukaryotic-like serine/threonine-protein kinase